MNSDTQIPKPILHQTNHVQGAQWKPWPICIAEHNTVELVNVSSILHSATAHQEIKTPESLIPLNSHISEEILKKNPI